MKKCLYLAMAATLVLAAFSAVTVANQEEKRSGYSVAPEKAGATETTRATKAVKLTIDNKSGQDVVFVSWRYWPGYYYSVQVPNNGHVEYSDFAAEWRINGVWTEGGDSQAGWGKAYKFDNDTTVTINQNTLTIK